MNISKIAGAAAIAAMTFASVAQAGTMETPIIDDTVFVVDDPTSGIDPWIVLGLAGAVALAFVLANDDDSSGASTTTVTP